MNATLELGPDGLRLIPGEHELHEPAFEWLVAGHPRPQGSKSQGRNGQMYEASGHIKAWRKAVTTAAMVAWRGLLGPADWVPLDGSLVLGAEFLFPRPVATSGPRAHWRPCEGCKGRQWRTRSLHCTLCDGAARRLRNGAPVYVTGTPDLSKLVRAVEDSLTDAGVWTDDSRVVGYAGFPLTAKRYANPGEEPGVWLRVWRVA